MNNNMEKEIFDIYIDDIIPNRFQPRLAFDEKSLNELADSIRQHGIIQPLVVRKIGDKYEIIAGERRYKAAQIAGLSKVPAVIMNLNDQESAEVAVVENIQRRDLSALEEAESYKKLLDKGYLTQEQLATRMGKTQSTVSNKLRLLGLVDEVKDALLNEKISERHARSLLSLKDDEKQREALSQIINNKLTVRQTDDLIKSMTSSPIETLDFAGVEQDNLAAPKWNGTSDAINVDNIAIPGISEEKQDVENKTVPNAVSFVDAPEVSILNPETSVSQTMIDQTPATFNMNNNQLKFDALPAVDVEKIKEESTDINPIVSIANMDNLLGITPKEEAPVEQEVSPIGIPKFRFINPLEEEDSDKETTPTNSFFNPISNNSEEVNNISEPKTFTDSLVKEYRQANGGASNQNEIVSGDLRSAISAITGLKKELEENDFKVNVEEFDFEHLYQVIIKIEK